MPSIRPIKRRSDSSSKCDFGGADETRLLDALRQDDADAYEFFVVSFGGAALAVARRYLKNEDDARDCVQDAFLLAFRNIGKFERRSSLATWLHRIVVNAALMKLRARARFSEEPIDELLPQFDTGKCRVEPTWRFEESVETLAQNEEARRRVRAAIGGLPDKYRIVLMLRDIEGYSTDEAAGMMDMTPGRLRSPCTGPARRSKRNWNRYSKPTKLGNKMSIRRKFKSWMFKLPAMLNCIEAEELFHDHHDGSLTAGRQWRLNMHLKLCRECSSYLQAYENTIALEQKAYKYSDTAEVLPPELAAQIISARGDKK